MIFFDIITCTYFRGTVENVWTVRNKLIAKYSHEYALYLDGEVEIEPFITYAEWFKELSGYRGRAITNHLIWRYSDFARMDIGMRSYYDEETESMYLILEYDISPRAIV